MNNNISPSSYVGVLDDKWHFRFGHVNKKTLDRMMKYDLIPKNNKSPFWYQCECCVQGKLCKHSFKSVEKTNDLLELIHSKICDKKSIETRGGKRYFITFIDDYSKYTYVYLIRTKDEAFPKFKIF